MPQKPPPSVFVVGDLGRHFHKTASCWRIRSGQAGKQAAAVREVPLDNLHPRQSPCRQCYPDSPRIRVRTPYCHTCESRRPCAHNGGVLVRVPRVWRYATAMLDPGDVTYAHRYVWPHKASRYEKVEDLLKV